MSTTTRYRKVSQGDANSEEESKKIRAERLERINSKIHAAVWVLVAIAVMYLTDMYNIVLHDTEIHRSCLHLAGLLIAINIGIMLYLTLWLPLVQKVTVPWEVYCPSMIPISTALGVSSIVLLMVTFWPVWGLLSPLIIIILVFGLLFSTHFIPWPC